jgi:L-ribulose-5-phosphate 3-epimerase
MERKQDDSVSPLSPPFIMNTNLKNNRRDFLKSSAVAMSAVTALNHVGSALAQPLETSFVSAAADGLKGRLWKTLKFGMVKVPGSLTDKFKIVKAAGFDGIEMNAPGMDVEETKKAISESGLPVDGTVNSSHWKVRHTDPDASVRAQALDSLKSAIRNTHAVGGHSVLLVVGHGDDGKEDVIWKRSIENISQAVPVAAQYGVQIVIENVWNHFLYDHAGDHTQNAQKYVKYVDELNSPWVGMQFDIGNHWKYGSMGDWIRLLGKRVYKLDIKGYNRAQDKWARISEGDIDYHDVRKALKEINFYGWCAAEVGGGDATELKRISDEMDTVFGLI